LDRETTAIVVLLMRELDEMLISGKGSASDFKGFQKAWTRPPPIPWSGRFAMAAR
jgi:hypothetical protein